MGTGQLEAFVIGPEAVRAIFVRFESVPAATIRFHVALASTPRLLGVDTALSIHGQPVLETPGKLSCRYGTAETAHQRLMPPSPMSKLSMRSTSLAQGALTVLTVADSESARLCIASMSWPRTFQHAGLSFASSSNGDAKGA
eukprot:6193481-Pleurochrysis_carterae.AAC.2